MCPKDADEMENRVDPDQTAPERAVRSGSALFAQFYLSQYLEFYCGHLIGMIHFNRI